MICNLTFVVPQIDPNWKDDDGVIMAVALDGVHYKIDEPRPFSTAFSSHKEGGNACLAYEIATYTHKPKIAWLSGPYPAAVQDKTIFRKKLKAAIEKKQAERGNEFRVVADDGYISPQ